MSVNESQVQVNVPAESQALADGIASLVLAIITEAKKGDSLPVQISADITAAVQNLVPALGGLNLLGGEVAGDKLGVVEALTLAGFKVARGL